MCTLCIVNHSDLSLLVSSQDIFESGTNHRRTIASLLYPPR